LTKGKRREKFNVPRRGKGPWDLKKKKAQERPSGKRGGGGGMAVVKGSDWTGETKEKKRGEAGRIVEVLAIILLGVLRDFPVSDVH